MIKEGFLAARLVKGVEVITPLGKQEVSLAQLYPGKGFMGFLPVFATKEEASEDGESICSVLIQEGKEAE